MGAYKLLDLDLRSLAQKLSNLVVKNILYVLTFFKVGKYLTYLSLYCNFGLKILFGYDILSNHLRWTLIMSKMADK